MKDYLARVYAAIDAVEESGTESPDFNSIRNAVSVYAATVGGLTINEVRRAQGLPPYDGGLGISYDEDATVGPWGDFS